MYGVRHFQMYIFFVLRRPCIEGPVTSGTECSQGTGASERAKHYEIHRLRLRSPTCLSVMCDSWVLLSGPVESLAAPFKKKYYGVVCTFCNAVNSSSMGWFPPCAKEET